MVKFISLLLGEEFLTGFTRRYVSMTLVSPLFSDISVSSNVNVLEGTADGTSVDGSDSVSVSDILVDTIITGGADSVSSDNCSFFEIDVGALHGSTGRDRAEKQQFPMLVMYE